MILPDPIDFTPLILDEVRMSANKAWVLASDYFKDKIATQLNRRAEPNARGGDRKSEVYKKSTL